MEGFDLEGNMQPVQSVAIIGAGNMGSGIAQKTAQEEFDVQMVDREAKWVERGQTIIADFLAIFFGGPIGRPCCYVYPDPKLNDAQVVSIVACAPLPPPCLQYFATWSED